MRTTASRWSPRAAAAVTFVAVAALTLQAQIPAGRPAGQKQADNFPRMAPLPFPDQPQTFETLGPRIRVVPMAKGLVDPWSLAFLPDGNILVTEKAGRLRIIKSGTLDPTPIAGTPEVWTTGQGGLLEVALHPKYAENQFIYLTYAKPGEKGAATALARGKFNGTTLADVKEIFVADNWGTGRPHFGSKIAFGPDGMLYMSLGERGERDKSQDPMLHNGKILRLKDDGTVPSDNPFVGKTGFRPEIFTYGHRNVQGLAFDSAGQLWADEHGPQGGDELNLVQAGKNYGWPLFTFGREYTGETIPVKTREGLQDPVMAWLPSIGITGLVVYTGDAFPTWKGSVLVGGLSGQLMYRVAFNDRGPIGREALLGSMRLRVRDVRQGPDGFVYVAVDGNPAGLLRIEPAPAGTDRP